MDIEKIIESYGSMLFRLCFMMLGNNADAEDAVQETLIQYYRKAPGFTDREHEKAWLLAVAANKCRDQLRFRSRHNHLDLDSLQTIAPESPDRSILEALGKLPEKYRLIMVLHYVEDYRVEDIAKIIFMRYLDRRGISCYYRCVRRDRYVNRRRSDSRTYRCHHPGPAAAGRQLWLRDQQNHLHPLLRQI